MKTTEQIKTFLETIEIENINILDYINIEEIDQNFAYESIFEMIHENNGFDVEIIYYSSACDYLKNNDNSFRDSIEIAIDMGYSIENLNSELLASLHASNRAIIDFQEYQDEINNFFN
jgi:hypothetical protein